jgi:hypothetical protein
MGVFGVGEGQRIVPNRRGIRGDLLGAHRVRPKLSGRDDMLGPTVSEGERGGDTNSVTALGGPWAIFDCWLESIPGALSSFSFSFSFSFYVFF